MKKLRIAALIALGALLGLAGSAAVLSSSRSKRFRAQYEAEKEALLARARAEPARLVEPAAIAGLPAPVRRYLDRAQVEGEATPRAAIVTQRGVIRGSPGARAMPFESEQAYAFGPGGFLWFADARVVAGLNLLARDAYVDGKGNMLIRLLGAFTLADARGAEIDQGAGLRFWGEAICFPEMALDPRIRWEAVDDLTARMKVEQGGQMLTALVEFDATGLPVAVHAERFRDVGGKAVLTPWSGHSTEWKVFRGRRFPSKWVSVWHLEGGDFTAVEMEVLSVRAE